MEYIKIDEINTLEEEQISFLEHRANLLALFGGIPCGQWSTHNTNYYSDNKEIGKVHKDMIKYQDKLPHRDPNTSCKDKSSGVKCKKVKKGKHTKPFYQNERW